MEINGRFYADTASELLAESRAGGVGGVPEAAQAATTPKRNGQLVRFRGVAATKEALAPAPLAKQAQATNISAVVEGTVRVGNAPEKNFKALRNDR